ncbi:hypothetical protein [Piscinibacterium candidicorallinum]|uniref:hypothetical protein n=1 Tax=Piscinibacterium candidicorallinum TaxID=1793872 RepID=UPI0039DF35B7
MFAGEEMTRLHGLLALVIVLFSGCATSYQTQRALPRETPLVLTVKAVEVSSIKKTSIYGDNPGLASARVGSVTLLGPDRVGLIQTKARMLDGRETWITMRSPFIQAGQCYEVVLKTHCEICDRSRCDACYQDKDFDQIRKIDCPEALK